MRKRMINPTIWLNKEFSKLKLSQRLFYIGLISVADDEGYFRADDAYLKSVLFPYDHIPYSSIKAMLDRISSKEIALVCVYEANGEKFAYHPKWKKHQYIRDARKTTFPKPPGLKEPSTPPQTLIQINPIQYNTKTNQFKDCLPQMTGMGFNADVCQTFCSLMRQFNHCTGFAHCMVTLDKVEFAVKKASLKGKIRNKESYKSRALENIIITLRERFTQEMKETGKKGN